MKKFILAATLALMTAPAFAAEPVVTPTNDENATLDQQVDENAINESATNDRAWYYGSWTCMARDRFGRTYYGTDYRRGRAISEALYSCRRHSFGGFWGGCYFRGCYRSGWGGGHGGWDGGHHGGWDGGHHGGHGH